MENELEVVPTNRRKDTRIKGHVVIGRRYIFFQLILQNSNKKQNIRFEHVSEWLRCSSKEQSPRSHLIIHLELKINY